MNFPIFSSNGTNILTTVNYVSSTERQNGFQPNTSANAKLVNSFMKSASLLLSQLAEYCSSQDDIGPDATVVLDNIFCQKYSNVSNQLHSSLTNNLLFTTSLVGFAVGSTNRNIGYVVDANAQAVLNSSANLSNAIKVHLYDADDNEIGDAITLDFGGQSLSHTSMLYVNCRYHIQSLGNGQGGMGSHSLDVVATVRDTTLPSAYITATFSLNGISQDVTMIRDIVIEVDATIINTSNTDVRMLSSVMTNDKDAALNTSVQEAA